MRIAAEGIGMSFDGKAVLSGVSLAIERPGVHALVGPNGSGKTTLMRILALLERPDSGTVAYDGVTAGASLSKASAKICRDRMVMVHNPPVMLSGSVRYNIEYGLRARRKDPAIVKRQTEEMGIDTLLNQNARTLSAGQAQRVALARAIATSPQVLFLDEPTANLDPESVRIIERAIEQLAAAGVAVVVASHNLWQVERIAQWMWFLNRGAIELSGPAGAVLHQGDHGLWAKFLGRDNLYSGRVEGNNGRAVFTAGSAGIEVVTDLRGQAVASINPTEVILSREPLRSSARNVLKGTVRAFASEAGLYRVTVDVGIPLVAAITKASWDELGLKPGDEAYAVFKATAVRVWREE